MTTIQTADGRLLRSTRPAGQPFASGGGSTWSLFANVRSEDPFWQTSDIDDSDWLVSYEAIYRRQPVVATAVDKLTRRISTLPFDSYRIGDDDTRELVRGDSLDTLIRKPMPRRNTVTLLAHIAQSLLVHGNGLVAKLRGPDRDEPPIMLWPLDWAQISAYGMPGGTIEGWSTRQFDGVERYIAVEDTLHFAWPGPSGSEIGVSPLEKLGVTIRLEDAAQRHQTSMFKNGVRPSTAISIPGDPKAETVAIVREAIERLHKGVDKSGKTMLLAGGATIAPLSLTPVEAALLEQRKLNREEVGMVYDLAGPLLNDLTHGTYSNVAELLKGLYRDVIPPWTELIVQTFQAQLLDTEAAWLDRVVRFDFSDKLKGEPTELSATTKSDVEAGLRTRNEGRSRLGLAPDGDPDDPDNPANQLTANLNNQGAIDDMAAGG